MKLIKNYLAHNLFVSSFAADFALGDGHSSRQSKLHTENIKFQ